MNTEEELVDAHGRMHPGHWPECILVGPCTRTTKRSFPDLEHGSLRTVPLHLHHVPRIMTPEYRPVLEWLARGGTDPIALSEDTPPERCADLASAHRRCQDLGLDEPVERLTLRVRVRYEDADDLVVDAGHDLFYRVPRTSSLRTPRLPKQLPKQPPEDIVQDEDSGEERVHTQACASKRRRCVMASSATGA